MANLLDLSNIIVNGHSATLLCKCLTSICTYLEGMSFEVIVVDNATFDGCGEMIAEEYPQVKFIQSRRNLGFACAKVTNEVSERATGQALRRRIPDQHDRCSDLSLVHSGGRFCRDLGSSPSKIVASSPGKVDGCFPMGSGFGRLGSGISVELWDCQKLALCYSIC